MKMPVNYQVSADNGYSTDENTEYLEKTWTLTVTYPHENSQAGWDMKFFNFS